MCAPSPLSLYLADESLETYKKKNGWVVEVSNQRSKICIEYGYIIKMDGIRGLGDYVIKCHKACASCLFHNFVLEFSGCMVVRYFKVLM